MGSETFPNVFIVESLRFADEAEELFEGRILRQILKLSGKASTYFYIRTRRELERIATKFGQSGFRYLHLSCHANARNMATTLDQISFPELGDILRPHLKGRRVFLSACEMATRELAQELLNESGCYSVIGPVEKIAFGDAALVWSSFYHLMFRTDEARMKRETITTHLQSTATLFGVRMKYFSKSEKTGRIRGKTLEPKNP